MLPDLLGVVDFFVAPLAVADTLPWLLAALQGQPLVAVELALELAIAVAVEVVVAVAIAAVATTVVVEGEVGEVAGAVASFKWRRRRLMLSRYCISGYSTLSHTPPLLTTFTAV